MSWNDVFKIVHEDNKDNKEKLSVLSEKARQIVSPFLREPFQDKNETIAKIRNLSKEDSSENQRYYEEAMTFFHGL